MDDDLLADIRADAESDGVTLSRWLADAAADRLRLKALRHVMTQWESEHGAVTPAELDAAEQKVARARKSTARRATRSEQPQAS